MRFHRQYFAHSISANWQRGLWFALLILLAACTPNEPEPTADPNAPTLQATVNAPTVTPSPPPDTFFTPIVPEDEQATPFIIGETPIVILPNPNPNPNITLAASPVLPEAGTPVPTAFIVNESGNGIRPADVGDGWTPLAIATLPLELRPPPYPVPLALHPDDHYWLLRPIPSGYRNYDLEWYPYGSDVLISELAPYRIHHGLDFPNDTGTPIMAVASGTVIFAGIRPSPRNGVNYYGNTIIIEHELQWQGQPMFTLYAHTLEMFVQEGDRVEQGQLIAGVGASGAVSGAHLHLELRVGNNNYFDVRNPLLWMAPFDGYGTLAGRFVDESGRRITSAPIVVKPLNVDTPARTTRTYYGNVVKSDEVWQENFVVGDLPAGRYAVELTVGGQTYGRTIEIHPGRTNFVIVQADVPFVPTATPLPPPTAIVTGTVPISPTVGLETPSSTPAENP